MKCWIWLHKKEDDTSYDFRFQISGIKHGDYTKNLDPIFKDWKECGSGYNSKTSTEVMIYSRIFSSEEEMTEWTVKNITFPASYEKCSTRCSTKILVADKDLKQEDNAKTRKTRTAKT